MFVIKIHIMFSLLLAAASAAGGAQRYAEEMKAHTIEHGAPAHPLHGDRPTVRHGEVGSVGYVHPCTNCMDLCSSFGSIKTSAHPLARVIAPTHDPLTLVASSHAAFYWPGCTLPMRAGMLQKALCVMLFN